MSTTPASASDLVPAPRASRRSRKAVKYYATDDEDFVDGDDHVYAVEPRMKKQKLEKSKAMAAAKPLASRQVFPFMLLPPEIRNGIYKMALFDPAGHHIIKHRVSWRRNAERITPLAFRSLNTNWWNRRRRSWYYRPATKVVVSEDEAPSFVPLSSKILRLSRTIYDEAVQILYSQPFILTDTYALHDFMIQIGPKHRALLRDVEVCQWGQGGAHGAMNYPAMAAMSDAVNLERLKLNVDKYGSSDLALKVWRDCYPFFEAYGRAKGRKDAVMDVLELYESQFKMTKHTEEKERFQKSLRYKLTIGKA